MTIIRSFSTSFSRFALLNLTKSFFAIPFTEQVEFFIIPALANENFPHCKWTSLLNESLIDEKERTLNSSTSSAWLLYSFLKLCQLTTGKFLQKLEKAGRG